MPGFSKPSFAPPHVKYLLTLNPPKIVTAPYTWAPVLVSDAGDRLTSGNATAVDAGLCVLGAANASNRKLLWVYGRSSGSAALVVDGIPTFPQQLTVDVAPHDLYRLTFDGPNVVVQAPDKDLARYKLTHVVNTNAGMSVRQLFDEILIKAEKGRIRNLVFQCHGFHGLMAVFGKKVARVLDPTNVAEFKRLAGKVERIWIMACITCADRAYMKSIADNAQAVLIGASYANPPARITLGKEQIDFIQRAQPAAMPPGGKLEYVGETFGRITRPGHVSAVNLELLNFEPA